MRQLEVLDNCGPPTCRRIMMTALYPESVNTLLHSHVPIYWVYTSSQRSHFHYAMVLVLFFGSTTGVRVMEWWNAELLSLGFGFVSDDGGIHPPNLFRLSVLLDFVKAKAPAAFHISDSRINRVVLWKRAVMPSCGVEALAREALTRSTEPEASKSSMRS